MKHKYKPPGFLKGWVVNQPSWRLLLHAWGSNCKPHIGPWDSQIGAMHCSKCRGLASYDAVEHRIYETQLRRRRKRGRRRTKPAGGGS